jgi:hypothetical protein
MMHILTPTTVPTSSPPRPSMESLQGAPTMIETMFFNVWAP